MWQPLNFKFIWKTMQIENCFFKKLFKHKFEKIRYKKIFF